MCGPLLTGGLTGYGISQANKKAEEKDESSVTNNYYSGTTEAENNKNSLKAGKTADKTPGPRGSQTSRSDKAY